MKKPQEWEKIAPALPGEFQQLPPGGYVCVINNAHVLNSQSGKEMLVLELDVAEGEYKYFFDKQFKANTFEPKKWPCVYYQMTEGNSQRYFKGLITSIEKSNSGYTWDWDEQTLRGKLIGMLFQRTEYFASTSGDYKWNVKPMAPRSVDKIRSGEFKVPEDKPATNKPTNVNGKSTTENVNNIPDDYEDDLPF